jgi:hypothetical protein
MRTINQISHIDDWIRFKYKIEYQNYCCLELEQTRNVLLLIFITTILALVSSALLYFLDNLLSTLLINFKYALKIPETFHQTIP